MQASSVLSLSPSFNTYSSSRLTEIAARVVEEFRNESEFNDDVFYNYHTYESHLEQQSYPNVKNHQEQVPNEEGEEDELKRCEDEGEKEDGDDFEFTFVCREPDTSPISADEIFSNGQIKPVFPIFNTDLLLGDDDQVRNDVALKQPQATRRLPLRSLFSEERDSPSCSSSEADELEGVPSGTYCVWKPKMAESSSSSPGRCKKSNSTGSSKRWKFRDLLHRSNSDGKDIFVFLTPSSSTKAKKSEENKEDEKLTGKSKTKGVSLTVTGESQLSTHVRNKGKKEGERRRSYLPYRQDLVGFFANVNGVSKNLHPF